MKSTIEDLSRTAKHFKELRREVENLTSAINPIEIVTPLNPQQVKAQWIEDAKSGHFTNPVFHYNESFLKKAMQSEYGLKVLLEKLDNNNAGCSAEDFYLEYLKDIVCGTLLTVEMAKAMQNQDDYNLAQVVLKKYGEANSNLVQHAEYLAQNGFTKKTEVEPNDSLKKLQVVTFDAASIAEFFTWAMEQYGEFSKDVSVWPVEILDNCSAIDVRDKSSYNYPLIAIPRTREVNGTKLVELIGHEIECHWRNSQNANLLSLPKLDDETIYEGVAKLKDYRFNERYGEKVSMPIPYYVLAQQYARAGGSFAETASYLTENYGLVPEKSWIYTYRTFRGASDMSNSAHYAFTKDRSYLEGFLYVQQAETKPEFRVFLNFGTLGKKQLERLSVLLNSKDVEKNTLPDLNIQDKTIQQILNRI